MKFYGSYGDLIKYYEVSLSQMLNGILGHDHIQWHPQSIRHYTNLWTYYRTWPYYRFWPYYQISRGFHGTLQRVLLANRGRLLLRTPGPVPFGTCICSNVETIDNFFPELVMSTEPLSFRTISTSLGTSILLCRFKWQTFSKTALNNEGRHQHKIYLNVRQTYKHWRKQYIGI